jgi:hypothetical protein
VTGLVAAGVPLWLVAAACGGAAAGAVAWQARRNHKATEEQADETKTDETKTDETETDGEKKTDEKAGQEPPGSAGKNPGAAGTPDAPSADAGAAPWTRREPDPFEPFTATTWRNEMSGGFPLATVAAEMNVVAARHTPADMWQVARELDQLREVPINVALAIRTYTTRLQGGEYPIHPVVVEQIYQLYKGLAQLTQMSEEIAATFRKVHANDLVRDEAPRPGERKWNVPG